MMNDNTNAAPAVQKINSIEELHDALFGDANVNAPLLTAGGDNGDDGDDGGHNDGDSFEELAQDLMMLVTATVQTISTLVRVAKTSNAYDKGRVLAGLAGIGKGVTERGHDLAVRGALLSGELPEGTKKADVHSMIKRAATFLQNKGIDAAAMN